MSETKEQEVPQLTNKSPEYKGMIKILQDLPTEEWLLRNTRRVNVFTFSDAFKVLCKEYEATKVKSLFEYLQDEGKIFKVEKMNANAVDVSIKRHLTTTDMFIWEKEDDSLIYIVFGILVVIGIVILGLFQIWPRWHRHVLYYTRYPLFGFLGFMMVAALVRVTVYLITLFLYKEQCWIWPNLFADCGFFESFVPLYEWTTEEAGEEKNDQENNGGQSETNGEQPEETSKDK